MNILIGENIKRLRKEKKITQETLADIFNVTPAAVSKWENNETYPDITLLFPLSNYFGVSIDELMGYNNLAYVEEIKKVKKDINDMWIINNNWEKAKALTVEAINKYPNDYELMIKYLFFITGGQADNDNKILIANEKEIIKACDLILEGCKIIEYQLEALVYKAKIYYVKGNKKEALDILNNFPSFYHTRGQKIEQLYNKGITDFYNQLINNINELAIFICNKLGKYIVYDNTITNNEKILKTQKFVELYKNISSDNDFDMIAKIIKEVVGEVKHRTTIVNFNKDEKERLELLYNDINNI